MGKRKTRENKDVKYGEISPLITGESEIMIGFGHGIDPSRLSERYRT